MTFKRRLEKLERQQTKTDSNVSRYLVCAPWKPLNLANSTCTRTLTPGGLMEFVNLDGASEDVTDEELDQFVNSFPIQECGAEKAQ